uniref:protein-tyrosine-phosphatase n=1 Tax=Sarcophilus harrisii TaxID=9305 RepID=A0A7N4NWZ5_SARHA
MKVPSTMQTSEFDSSDEEPVENEQTPFQVSCCYGGLGRSCLVAACLLLYLSDTVSPQQAIDSLRDLRGSGAIQTIKQYNYLHDFRDKLAAHLSTRDSVSRSVSR